MKNKANPSLTELADAALKQAARKVIERAKLSGTPVIMLDADTVRVEKKHISRQAKVVSDADK